MCLSVFIFAKFKQTTYVQIRINFIYAENIDLLIHSNYSQSERNLLDRVIKFVSDLHKQNALKTKISLCLGLCLCLCLCLSLFLSFSLVLLIVDNSLHA